MKKKSNQGHGKDASKFIASQPENSAMSQVRSQMLHDSTVMPRSGALEAVSKYVRESKGCPVESTTEPASEIVAEALAAFDKLNKCGSAAVALAMMNSNFIKQNIDTNDGWQDLELSAFRPGIVELSRLLADQFHCELLAWRDEVQKPEAAQGLTRCNVETAVEALKHLLYQQGNELVNRINGSGAFGASVVVVERLESAYNCAMESWHKIHAAAHSKTK
ncbi:MAG TPA: hypothetical protein VMD27_06390 [Candidatus Aquilonibacter sp.]|nr:hypothetical protein [Candidatus Aquilonibacter sp.]